MDQFVPERRRRSWLGWVRVAAGFFAARVGPTSAQDLARPSVDCVLARGQSLISPLGLTLESTFTTYDFPIAIDGKVQRRVRKLIINAPQKSPQSTLVKSRMN
jgi:hypothetical protein